MPSTKPVVKCRFVLFGGARTFDTLIGPEAATQTFKRGDILGFTSGKLRCNVSAAANLDSSGDEVAGVALRDASGTTDADVPYVPLDTNVGLVLPVTHATPASAVTAVTQRGSTFCLERTAAGDWSVPIDDTSNPVCEIRDIDPTYAVGEQYGLVHIKIIAAERAVAA